MTEADTFGTEGNSIKNFLYGAPEDNGSPAAQGKLTVLLEIMGYRGYQFIIILPGLFILLEPAVT